MVTSKSDSFQIAEKYIRDSFFNAVRPSVKNALVCEIGTLGFVAAKHAMFGVNFKRVQDGWITSEQTVVVNWSGETESAYCELAKVSEKLDEQRTAFAAERRPHGWSEKRLRDEGLTPTAAATRIADYLHNVADINAETTLVGHGLSTFSLPFYLRFMQTHAADRYAVLENMLLLDTGCLYKAVLHQVLQQEQEPFAVYTNRVMKSKGGGKWNIFQAATDLGIVWPVNQDGPLDMLAGGSAVAWELFKYYYEK